MGADIHAHFEIKVAGEWLHYSQPNIQRDYRLFTKMAGVRCIDEVEPISKPRGLPSGQISKTTALEARWWGSDGHSHSWLNAKEIAEVIKFHLSLPDVESWRISHFQWFYLNGNDWESFLEYPKDYPEEIEDIRLIFWFDN